VPHVERDAELNRFRAVGTDVARRHQCGDEVPVGHAEVGQDFVHGRADAFGRVGPRSGKGAGALPQGAIGVALALLERPEVEAGRIHEIQLGARGATGLDHFAERGSVFPREPVQEIAKAEKAAKARPNDAAAKTALGEAYLKRGVALTEARQYASALGDYRRTLKYDPDNAEAKQWVDQIIKIYDSMGRESPPEGQEPPPLPYKPKK